MHGSTAQFSSADLQLLEELSRARARESFREFRRQIKPQMLWGWWLEDVTNHLQRFYERLDRRKAAKDGADGAAAARQELGDRGLRRLGGRQEPGKENDLCELFR